MWGVCPLKLCTLNAQSVKNKTEALSAYIITNDVDVCVITETWLTATDNAVMFEITPVGYKLICSHRADRRGGGLAIIFKENLKFKSIEMGERSSYEFLELYLADGSVSLRLVAVYRPPFSPTHRVSIGTFIDEFNEYLSVLLLRPGKLLLTGDFNIAINKVDDDVSIRFLDMISYFGMQQHTVGSTHIHGNTLDLVLTVENDGLIISKPAVGEFLSDHAVVVCYLSLKKPKYEVREVKIRKLKSIDCETYLDDIKNELRFNPDSDVEVNCSLYHTVLTSILDKHAPVLINRVSARPKLAWMNDSIRPEIKKRRRLERKWRHSHNDEDLKAFKLQRNKVNNIMKNAKTQFYKDKIDQCEGDLKSLFNLCNKLLNCKPKTQYPNEDNDTEVANNFSSFFISKIDKIRLAFKTSSSPIEASHKQNHDAVQPFQNFTPVSTDDISTILKNCEIKSCDLDPCPTYLLKLCYRLPEFLDITTKIMNQSLLSGVFPDSFKRAMVIPLLKKPNLDFMYENYRPISNLSFMSKLLERIVAKQLLEHITENDLDVKYQSAYKAFHSTETALLRVQNDILQSMDRNEVAILIMLDLSAAFDTVDINILLYRLSTRYNISGTVLTWFSTYLNNRSQFVSVNGCSSKTVELKCGIPQGSVLGPKLFSIYTAPLYEIIEHHGMKYHLYADDTQIYLFFKPGDILTESIAYARLQQCLYDIKVWMFENKLQLNSDKTEYMVIGRRNLINKIENVSFKFDSSVISKSNVVKNLGVYFDDSLSMTTHINHLLPITYAESHDFVNFYASNIVKS